MTDPQIWAITENMVDPTRITHIPEEEVAWVAHNLTHLGIDDWNYFFVEEPVDYKELLSKYVAFTADCEGVGCRARCWPQRREHPFTDAEATILLELERQ